MNQFQIPLSPGKVSLMKKDTIAETLTRTGGIALAGSILVDEKSDHLRA